MSLFPLFYIQLTLQQLAESCGIFCEVFSHDTHFSFLGVL